MVARRGREVLHGKERNGRKGNKYWMISGGRW
jgi:hypothetical protein